MSILASAMFLFAGSALKRSTPAATGVVRFTLDPRETHDISKYVYGANFPDWSKMKVPFTVARLGGNRMTAYNWETNASNAGNDFHNQNDGYMGESDEPGRTLSNFLKGAQSHGAAAIITIPTAGYVAADKKADGDVSRTPDYLNVRFLKSYAKKPGGHFTYPPDTRDKAVYQDECVHWLESIKSPKTPLWYMLDNEPDIWASTHSKIVTKPETYGGIIANNLEFASAIKAVAPKALIFGPANYGWQGFRTFQNAPDAHGRDFLNSYLDAMRKAEVRAGKRLLDVLDIHWYPEAQGGGVRIVTDRDKPGTAEARIQAPRSLWDPGYRETSWIQQSLGDQPIELLPRILGQIHDHYPGTRFSISEYNYGGGRDVSGAIAQADVLGIFGRYGLFAACNWGVGPQDSGILAGYRAFLNFDGRGGAFGAREIGVRGEEPEKDSLYASLDEVSGKVLTLVAINKTQGSLAEKVDLGSLKARSARGFVITASNLATSRSLAVNQSSSSISFAAPALSVASIEVRLR